MQEGFIDTSSGQDTENKSGAIYEHLCKYKLVTPVAAEIIKIAFASDSFDELAEIICMLEEIQAYERQVCCYCNSLGHKPNKCEVFHQLEHKTRGDININKARGHRAEELRFNARKGYI